MVSGFDPKLKWIQTDLKMFWIEKKRKENGKLPPLSYWPKAQLSLSRLAPFFSFSLLKKCRPAQLEKPTPIAPQIPNPSASRRLCSSRQRHREALVPSAAMVTVVWSFSVDLSRRHPVKIPAASLALLLTDASTIRIELLSASTNWMSSSSSIYIHVHASLPHSGFLFVPWWE